MTQPDPKTVQIPEIGTATSLVQTPAGPMGVLTLSSGTAQFGLMMTDEQAGQLAQILPKALTEMAAAIRRTKLGLIVPANGAVPPMPDPRGNHGRP